MTIGHYLIIGALSFIILSAFSYLAAMFDRSEANKFKVMVGRITFFIATLIVTSASALLMYYILTHNFMVKYVYGYSSLDLAFGYLVSSFWAGQEGSFLFWTFCLVWMGLVFIKFAKENESESMLLFNIIMIFFIAILIKASPFEMYDQRPTDGAGLNPLLQNPWMVIHPPVLFIGYAACTFPFIIALAAVLQKSYGKWVESAMPWTIFASFTLGAGIILGGFWAYEVLGWGGYWGWDPVENSSLVPWLVIIALLHGLVVQRRKGVLQRTNIFLAIMTFTFVIYATFLTRSGILQDFSVHSFQDLGIGTEITIFNLVVFIGGLVIFLYRIKSIPTNPVDMNYLNRENTLISGMFLFGISAILIAIGTSSPLITSLFGETAQVDISYYNRVNLPLGMLIALAVALSPNLAWMESKFDIHKRIIFHTIVAVIFIVIAFAMGMKKIIPLFFILFSGLAVSSNVVAVIRQLKTNWRYSGAQISHFGLSIMLVGIIVSSIMDKSEIINIPEKESKSALGYEFKFLELEKTADNKNILKIEANKNGKAFQANPRMYYNEKMNNLMREPDIKASFLYDLYISPLEYKSSKPARNPSLLTFKKGETIEVQGYQVTFKEFVMDRHMSDSGEMTIGARLEVTKNDRAFELVPQVKILEDKRNSIAVTFPESEFVGEKQPKVQIINLDADKKEIVVNFTDLGDSARTIPGKPAEAVIQVSTKPFMAILWTGTIIMMFGFILALYRRTALTN